MININKFSSSRFGTVLREGRFVLALILLVTIAWSVQTFAASPQPSQGEHLVSVYDGGTEKNIITRATTVGDALKAADVQLDPADVVEPKRSDPLLAKNYHINVYRARPVVIVDGMKRERIITAEQSPRQIMKAAGETLYDEDTTQFQRVDNVLDDGGAGLKLVVDRATPFTFVLYGKSIDAHTQAKTVGDMLSEKGVKLGPDDGVSVPATTPITTGMSVAVWRNGVQTITQEEAIAPPIEQIKDQDQPIGYHVVKTPGTPGKKQVTYQINMQNGVEISRSIIQSVTTLEPAKQVEAIGAKITNTFSGDFAGALVKLRTCEAGGAYNRNSGNGYYGAYQYDVSTWANYGGFTYASDAPASVQDQKVWETYQRRGWAPWPSCSKSQGLQDIYR